MQILSDNIKRTLSYLLTVAVVAFVIWTWVWLQWSTVVKDSSLFWAILAIGVVCSGLFSGLEMALATFGSEKTYKTKIQDDLAKYFDRVSDPNDVFSQAEYKKHQKKWSKILYLHDTSDTVNGAIVIANNVVNIALATYTIRAFYQVSESSLVYPFKIIGWGYALPGGTELFNLASISLAIIIFGEIVPKRLGMRLPWTIMTNGIFVFIVWLVWRLLGWLSRGFGGIEELMSKVIKADTD